MGAIAAEVCRPADLGPADVDRWHGFMGASQELVNPFVGPELARAVGDVRADAFVAVVLQDGQVAGYFPFLRGRRRTAMPISGALGTSQAFVHRPGLAWSWAGIAAAAGLAAVDLSYLVGSQATGGTFRMLPSPVVDTAGGFDAYLARVGARKFLKTVLYKQRKLERDVGVVDVHFGAPDADGVAALMRWKSDQYRRTGRRDPFAQRWVRDLVERLLAEDGPWLRPVFSAVRAGGTLVAVDLSLRCQAVLGCWFGAYDPAFGAYSPGAVRTLRMIEAAAAAGIGRLELSAGDEVYKHEWKTGDGVVADGYVVVPGPAAAARRVARSGRAAARHRLLASPRLRSAVRRSLLQVGSLRTTVLPRARWER